MPKHERYQDRIELLQGTLDMLILQTLQRGPLHGYAITQALRVGSRDVLQVDAGSLYPAMHRLERQGWVTAEWTISESQQRVRSYKLTRLGRSQLADKRSRWERMAEAIADILNPKAPEGGR
jgi:transcriptional regulator